MERVIERCCGLDVHKKTVVAGVRVPGRTSVREQHVRTFGTTLRYAHLAPERLRSAVSRLEGLTTGTVPAAESTQGSTQEGHRVGELIGNSAE